VYASLAGGAGGAALQLTRINYGRTHHGGRGSLSKQLTTARGRYSQMVKLQTLQLVTAVVTAGDCSDYSR